MNALLERVKTVTSKASKRGCLVIVTGLLVVSEAAVTAPVGLREIYDLALANDPRILAADFENQAAQFDIPIARAARRPTLSAQLDIDQDIDSFTDDDDELRAEPGLTLDIPIYNRRSNVNINLAESVAEEAELNFRQQELSLFVRTAELYFAVLRADDGVRIATAARESIESQVALAKQLLEEQLVAVFDEKEAQASFDLANATLIEAQNSLAGASEALRVAINQYPPELARIVDDVTLTLPQPADVDFWVEMGLSNNPSLQLARLQLIRSGLEFELAKSDHYPTVGLLSSYTFNGSANTTRDRVGSGEVSLQFNLPLYQGRRVEARKAQAILRQSFAEQQLVLAQRSVEQQIKNAYANVQTSYERSRALEQAVVSNLESLKLTEEGVKEQVRTIVDLLEVTSRYTRAQLELSSARYDFLFSTLTLSAFSGELSANDLSELDKSLR